MAPPSQTAKGSKQALKPLVEKALALLKLAKEEILVKQSDLGPEAKKAEQSAEELLAALQNTEDLAVENYGREIKRLQKEVKDTDWSKYRRKNS